MRWRWWWALIPLLLGVMAALFFMLTEAPNPILYAQADLGTFLFGIGVGLSVVIELILSIFDQTEKIQIENTIQNAEDRRRFLRRLDHELKNPLTAILAGLANLSIAETPADQFASLGSVQTQVGRLSRLVAELRKLSELETRPLDLDFIDMNSLLEDVFALAQDHPEFRERALTLSIPRAPWPLPTINGDRDLLVLAIHNLLDNAIKFTQPGDTIEIRASEDGSSIVVEVADTGPGIPVEDQDHVWEELYRGEGARSTQGSGLGLALVRTIIARHRGTISLRSRPGEGTVFVIHLPVEKLTKR